MVDRQQDEETLERGPDGAPRIRRPAAPWLFASSCQAVFEALERAGEEARAVGGAVRNTLLGQAVSDVDIATPAVPPAVTAAARSAGLSVHPTGIEHGTVTVVSAGVPYEVTTLRRDVSTDGRRATIAYSTDWAEDARRRDFTMNAIYCDRNGVIFDPLGGLDDLRQARVRFIGSARERIREDYLRILRFFRFFAAYGSGPIDAEGLAAIDAEKDGLAGLSAERVRAETLKLVVAPRAFDALAEMERHAISRFVFGRPISLAAFAKYCAIERVLEQPANAILRLAALAANDKQAAGDLARRLKLSNRERKLLVTAGEGRQMRPPASDETRLRQMLYRCGPDAYSARVLMGWLGSNADPDDGAFRRAAQLPQRWAVPEFPIKGSDIVAEGVAPGPKIGELHEALESWWVSEDFSPDAQALRRKLEELIAMDDGM